MFAVFAPSLYLLKNHQLTLLKKVIHFQKSRNSQQQLLRNWTENNHIDNIHMIYVGQELVIDGPAAPVAPASTTYEAPAAQDEAVSAPVAETTEVEEETPVVSETVAEETVVSTVSGSEAEAKEWIAQKESGGSYTATNGRYIGRYQLTDSYLNGDYSAENQERVADAYVAGRYGSWTAAKTSGLIRLVLRNTNR